MFLIPGMVIFLMGAMDEYDALSIVGNMVSKQMVKGDSTTSDIQKQVESGIENSLTTIGSVAMIVGGCLILVGVL